MGFTPERERLNEGEDMLVNEWLNSRTTCKQPITSCRQVQPSQVTRATFIPRCVVLSQHDSSCFTFFFQPLFAMLCYASMKIENTRLSRHANMVSHCLLFLCKRTIHQHRFLLVLPFPLTMESIKA